MLNFLKNLWNGHKKKIISIAILLGVLVSAFAVYVGIYYPADDEMIERYVASSDVKIVEKAGAILVGDENAKRGFVFYPGGKVEADAYIPLAVSLAEAGIFTVIVKMPFNLAVFGLNSANRYIRKYSRIEKWYVGGHSLGGSMAASYAKSHSHKVEGLILLGSYSATDLSATDVSVFTAYGSEDGVLDMKKYEKNLSNLPGGYSSLVIAGGNHSGFGMYGEQRGDGVRLITTEEQISIVTEMIDGFTRR